MSSNTSKKSLTILIYILIVLLIMIVMIFPDKIGYKYVIKDIKDKTKEYTTLGIEVLGNESKMEHLLLDLYNKENIDREVKARVKKLLSNINKDDLVIHIPSILISLDQNAIKNDIDLIIKYNEMNEIEGGEGLSITTIPLELKGEYSDVSNFLKYVDEVDLLEPEKILLKSNGDTVSGSLIINIFHGDIN